MQSLYIDCLLMDFRTFVAARGSDRGGSGRSQSRPAVRRRRVTGAWREAARGPTRQRSGDGRAVADGDAPSLGRLLKTNPRRRALAHDIDCVIGLHAALARPPAGGGLGAPALELR